VLPNGLPVPDKSDAVEKVAVYGDRTHLTGFSFQTRLGGETFYSKDLVTKYDEERFGAALPNGTWSVPEGEAPVKAKIWSRDDKVIAVTIATNGGSEFTVGDSNIQPDDVITELTVGSCYMITGLQFCGHDTPCGLLKKPLSPRHEPKATEPEPASSCDPRGFGGPRA